MTLKETYKTNKLFKRKGWKIWYNKIEERECGIYVIYENNDSYDIRRLSLADIFADDWIVKEEWYKGDFRKKYPNGVLCWIKLTYDEEWFMTRITNYNSNKEYCFIEENKESNYILGYKEAIPVTPEEAPTIIGGE